MTQTALPAEAQPSSHRPPDREINLRTAWRASCSSRLPPEEVVSAEGLIQPSEKASAEGVIGDRHRQQIVRPGHCRRHARRDDGLRTVRPVDQDHTRRRWRTAAARVSSRLLDATPISESAFHDRQEVLQGSITDRIQNRAIG